MKLLALLLVGFMGWASTSSAESLAAELPFDVKAFDEKRESCIHFLGEEPYDAERKTDLIKQLKKYCAGNDKSLKRLKKKYSKNAAVLAKLNSYGSGLE